MTDRWAEQAAKKAAHSPSSGATPGSTCHTLRGRARGGHISARESDDLLRQAEMFLEIVQDLLGVPLTVPLPQSITPVSRSRASGA